MQNNLPQWARKPKHSKEVVATPLGWMVKDTGEYLKLVKNLDQKLLSLRQEVEQSVEVIQEADQKENETLDFLNVNVVDVSQSIETTTENENPVDLVVDGDFDALANVDQDSVVIVEVKKDDSVDEEITDDDQPVVKPRRRGRRPKSE